MRTRMEWKMNYKLQYSVGEWNILVSTSKPMDRMNKEMNSSFSFTIPMF